MIDKENNGYSFFTDKTLLELLNNSDKTVKRHAMGILKALWLSHIEGYKKPKHK